MSVGFGVGVSVGTGVSVGFGIGVSVGAGVSVGFGVGVSVGSGVSVGFGVGVSVGCAAWVAAMAAWTVASTFGVGVPPQAASNSRTGIDILDILIMTFINVLIAYCSFLWQFYICSIGIDQAVSGLKINPIVKAQDVGLSTSLLPENNRQEDIPILTGIDTHIVNEPTIIIHHAVGTYAEAEAYILSCQ